MSTSLPEPKLRTETLWTALHTLLVVAQLGSFTKAAQRLGVSKASVSQRIAELERALGQTLVARTTRSVRLSEAGQRLVEGSEAGFALLSRSLSQTRDAAGQPRGLLRITAPVALGRQHVAPALPDFLRAYPEIRVELDLSDRLTALTQEGFDLAVRHTSAPPPTHVAFKLCASRSLLVASQAYLQAHGQPTQPGELSGHDCLPYLRPGAAVWHFEQSGSADEPMRVSVPVQGRLRASNSEALREAALAGLGIALLPDFSALPALQSGALRLLLPDWRPVGFFGDAIYAIHPWSAQTPRPVQLFVEHLRAVFGTGFEAGRE